MGGHLQVVLDSLIRSCSEMGASEAKFAEARRDAVHSITRSLSHSTLLTLTTPPLLRICSTVHAGAGGGVAEESCDSRGGSCDLSVTDVEAVFGCYMRCLGDYTRDSRGDIEAGVREAVMTGISTLLPLYPLSPQL